MRKLNTFARSGNALLGFAALLYIFAAVATLHPLGQSDRDAAPAGTGPVETQSAVTAARQEMGRLVALSARFGREAGDWSDVDLPEEYQNQTPSPVLTRGFSTDFSRALIPFDDIISGGPPKDGIPSIDRPQFVGVAQARAWLSDNEPVILYRHNDVTRVYPLQILTWHEIVNDVAGGRPIAVTFCPLCNTGMVFNRRFGDEVLEFGVSGRLLYSNMIMYDRSRESWWIQATGQAIAGDHAGQRLGLEPSSMLSWGDVRSLYPEAEVLSRDTGYRRDYGRNPYAGYDSSSQPFLYQGPAVLDDGEDPMERILSVYHGDEVRALEYSELEDRGVVQFTLDDAEIVVFWSSGTASALDSPRIRDGRDVGSAAAYYLDEPYESLSFEFASGTIRDTQTGSQWHVSGQALSGELSGTRLRPARAVEHFRFSWRAFHGQ